MTRKITCPQILIIEHLKANYTIKARLLRCTSSRCSKSYELLLPRIGLLASSDHQRYGSTIRNSNDEVHKNILLYKIIVLYKIILHSKSSSPNASPEARSAIDRFQKLQLMLLLLLLCLFLEPHLLLQWQNTLQSDRSTGLWSPLSFN